MIRSQKYFRTDVIAREFTCWTVSGAVVQQSLVRLFNSYWHDSSTVAGTILQQSRARFFLFSMLAEFFNSEDHCWRIVPYSRNPTFTFKKHIYIKKNPPHLLIYWWGNQVIHLLTQKKWEYHLKKKKIWRKVSAPLLKRWLCDSFHVLLVQINSTNTPVHYQIHTFSNNLNDGEMIRSHLMFELHYKTTFLW